MDIEYILGRTIKLREVVKTHPELFDLKKLSVNELANLVRYDQAAFLDVVAPLVTKADDRITVLTLLGSSPKLKKARERFALQPHEVDKVSNPYYFNLLKTDFDKYIKKERFEKLSKHDQSTFCLQRPQWFLDNFAILPKLTASNLYMLAQNEPKFVDEQVKDFTDLSTYAGFWDYMIKYNSKYEDIFLANTSTLVTKTDVRMTMRKYPRMVKKLDETIIASSKLTVKEWILLCDEIIRSNKVIFNKWKFKDELKEIFRLDLTAEILMGKSKVSVRSQNAMDKVIKIAKVEEDDTPTIEAEEE